MLNDFDPASLLSRLSPSHLAAGGRACWFCRTRLWKVFLVIAILNFIIIYFIWEELDQWPYTCNTDWCFVRNSIGAIPTAFANLRIFNWTKVISQLKKRIGLGVFGIHFPWSEVCDIIVCTICAILIQAGFVSSSKWFAAHFSILSLRSGIFDWRKGRTKGRTGKLVTWGPSSSQLVSCNSF